MSLFAATVCTAANVAPPLPDDVPPVPVAPRGMLNVSEGAAVFVLSIATLAAEPAGSVTVGCTVKTGVVPAGPLGPAGPAAPVAPVPPCAASTAHADALKLLPTGAVPLLLAIATYALPL